MHNALLYTSCDVYGGEVYYPLSRVWAAMAKRFGKENVFLGISDKPVAYNLCTRIVYQSLSIDLAMGVNKAALYIRKLCWTLVQYLSIKRSVNKASSKETFDRSANFHETYKRRAKNIYINKNLTNRFHQKFNTIESTLKYRICIFCCILTRCIFTRFIIKFIAGLYAPWQK